MVQFLACLVLSAGGVHPQVFSQTDTQAEIQEGRRNFDQLVRNGYVSKNEAFNRRVQRVVSQLTSALPVKLYPFQAVVLADNEVNAGCLPGGFIIVNEGLLTLMPTDEELAFTLAHEIGHAVRRHWARDRRNDQIDVSISILITAISKTAPDQTANYYRKLQNSREHETEADTFGTELYLRAGFDPGHITDAMQVLVDNEKKHGGSDVPEYARTHPFGSKRLITIASKSSDLLSRGLKPTPAGITPDTSIVKLFGKIPTISPQPCKWQPTEPGFEWNYEIVTASSQTRYRVRAIGRAEVDSTTVCRFEINLGSGATNYQIIADGDRVWRRNRLDREESAWDVSAMFPGVQGVAESNGRFYKNDGAETIETPAGTFPNCLKLQVKESSGKQLTEWYAEGVGMVKRIHEGTGIAEILSSYKKP